MKNGPFFRKINKKTELKIMEFHPDSFQPKLSELIDFELKILVVDDNAVNRVTEVQVIKQATGQENVTVNVIVSVDEMGDIIYKESPKKASSSQAKSKVSITTVNSGYEALRLIERGTTFDLIILDDKMPKITGEQTSADLRQLEQRKQLLPHIILTCSDTYRHPTTGQKRFPTANGMVDKPMSKASLQNPDGDFYQSIYSIRRHKRGNPQDSRPLEIESKKKRKTE